MPHQMSIPDNMWNWAEERCIANSEGPASFLRNIIIGAMATDPSARKTRSQDSQTVGKGKAVHQRCFQEMAKEFIKKYPDRELPFSTPLEAKFITNCPYCYDHVRIGEPASMTTMKDWEASEKAPDKKQYSGEENIPF
jgi:hypothetical protein